MNRWPSLAATICVLVAGYSSLALGTDGWRIWTAESARRQAVLENPRPIPDHPLRDSRGGRLTLAGGGKRIAVVDLIYTRCPTVCQAMGAQFRQLQGELATIDLLDDVELVSVTFDPANDDDAALGGYLRRFGAIEPGWRAARFDDDAHLDEMLEELGVVVIPEPRVGFVHNAAFYVIEGGSVVEIIDVDDRPALFDAILRRMPEKPDAG